MNSADRKVEIREAYDELETIRVLFKEYVRWIGLPLDFQDYDEELAALPGQYAKPEGRLYLASADARPAGCCALKYFDTTQGGRQRCEIKRLYVRDEFKGSGIGAKLAEQAIAQAREIGYAEMLLDTFDFMESAIGLYRKLGFIETDAYRYNPYKNAKYFRLKL